ncbi:MAG: hypothetical protein EBT47_01290, partial [Chloroflexi bacterium]|nr:hypothetical protein [Chloroflexota bacterium]
RLNSALEPSFFHSVDPPRASADSPHPGSAKPRRVVSPWVDDFADFGENAESGNILVAMWSDGERQGWFVLSLMLLASLVALIGYSTSHPPARDLFGTVTGDRFASTEMLRPGTSTNASAFDLTSQKVSERNTKETPASGDQEAIWRRSLPVALGMVWLIGAWIIDREARRALVIKEPWGERRGIAYGMIAIVVVLPLMIAQLEGSQGGLPTCSNLLPLEWHETPSVKAHETGRVRGGTHRGCRGACGKCQSEAVGAVEE